VWSGHRQLALSAKFFLLAAISLTPDQAKRPVPGAISLIF
jgi:hypothetical protein